MGLIEQRKTQMREFLGKVAAEALALPDVEFVSVRLISIHTLEDDGYDGEIRLLLSGERKYGYMFSAMELEYIREPQWMIDAFREKFLAAMAKETVVERVG